jgi:hypothetical protein
MAAEKTRRPGHGLPFNSLDEIIEHMQHRAEDIESGTGAGIPTAESLTCVFRAIEFLARREAGEHIGVDRK